MILSWNTTNQCNMLCSHCYRDAGEKAQNELTTVQAKKLIDEIVQAGFKIMIFSGGEPLMREDIFELIKYASSKKLRPVIGTNGSLITPEVARSLKSAGLMGAGISLDSLDRDKHDHLRKFDGAWQMAVNGMKSCREAGIGFQIHTTVMDWNECEIEAITDFAVDMGAVAHHIFFLIPTGRGEQIVEKSLKREEYEAVLTRIMKKAAKVSIEVKPTCAPQFMRISHEINMNVRFGKGCIAGIAYCIISPRGDVQPCAYMKNEIGNVKETPFNEIWANNPVFIKMRTQEYKGFCGECSYQKVCGGCRARAAYYNDGDYMAADPVCIQQEA